MKMLLLPATVDELIRPVESNDGESNLDFMYRNIGCRTVTVRTVLLDGREYDLWCDDEALLTNDPVLNHRATSVQAENAFNPSEWEYLFGHVLVARSDDDGNTVALDDTDIAHFVLSMQAKIRDAIQAARA